MWLLLLVGIFVLQTVAAQTADDFEIESLPGIDTKKLGFPMHAGLIPVKHSKRSSLFFWRIGSEEPSNITVIWLNGGPGCSSMDGLFLENGPFRMKKDQSIELNPGGWQRFATVVYVDQPVGTGFSTTKNGYLQNMAELTDEFMTFIDYYSKIFPSIHEQEVYIAGESYAGTYIPYYAMPLLKRIKENSSRKYNLKGLMIGNGWISPKHQYDAYYDFAIKNNLIKDEFIKKMKDQMVKCKKVIEKKIKVHVDECEDLFSIITEASVKTLSDGKKICINAYDMRLTNETYELCGADWPHEGVQLQKYLRKPELMKAIHVQGRNISWVECDNTVYAALEHDKSEPSYPLLPIILEDIPIMLFSGDQDIICNHIGTEYLIGNMTWNGARGLSNKAKKTTWMANGQEAGYIIEDRSLSYALIKGASHMAPYDKPLETLGLFKQFLDMYNNDSKKGKKLKKLIPAVQNQNQNQKRKRGLQNTTLTEVNEDKRPQHNYWGAGILVIMTVFTTSLCCCWYYERKRPIEKKLGKGAFKASNIKMEEMIFGKVKDVFNYKNNQGSGLRLDEIGSSDDMDILINHPSLFEIDDEDDSDTHSETSLYSAKV